MKLSVDQLLSAYSELRAEQTNAHKEADAIDSKKAAEAHLDENCPICSAGANLLSQDAREIEKFGEFVGEIAARSFGAAHMLTESLGLGVVTPDRVALLVMTAVQVGHKLGRRDAIDQQVNDGYIWKKGPIQ